jgi:hypothetical protein
MAPRRSRLRKTAMINPSPRSDPVRALYTSEQPLENCSETCHFLPHFEMPRVILTRWSSIG